MNGNGNRDWGRAIPRKGIHKWYFRCRGSKKSGNNRMKEGTVQSSSRFNIFWKNPEPYCGPAWLTSTHTGVIFICRMFRTTARCVLIPQLNTCCPHRVQYTQSGNGRFLAYIPSWWKNQPWLVRVRGARPPPFTLVTITYKVVVYASAERADTLPLFHLYPYIYSVFVLVQH